MKWTDADGDEGEIAPFEDDEDYALLRVRPGESPGWTPVLVDQGTAEALIEWFKRFYGLEAPA